MAKRKASPAATERQARQAALHAALAASVKRRKVEEREARKAASVSAPRLRAKNGSKAPSATGPESQADLSTEAGMLIPAATIVGPDLNTHSDGAWPLTDLRQGQCRFACTPDDAPRDGHRFCGRRTSVGTGNLHGSWCGEHHKRMFDPRARLGRPAFLKGAMGGGLR